MVFYERLNEYIKKLECSAKELSEASNISPTVISRYRKGERVPSLKSTQLEALANGLANIAKNKNISLSKQEIFLEFSKTLNDIEIDFEQLRLNFSDILTTLDIKTSELSRSIGFDSSMVSKIRSGKRNPSNPKEFVSSVSNFIVTKYKTKEDKAKVAGLLEIDVSEISTEKAYLENLIKWLSSNVTSTNKYIDNFLNNVDTFNLDDYIKVIKFDKMKIPFVPFYKPMSKNYYGVEEMKKAELEFFKSTVLSKSNEPIFMCSDMPMEDMAKDLEFGKKWIFAIAMSLKKGLHLNIIHDLNRPFNEMMIGLESWIPIYMTGQISPYYLKDIQNSVYCHLNYVSGSTALTGECITGNHEKGKYYLSTNSHEVEYYANKFKCLMTKASPLMEIYRKENKKKFESFLFTERNIKGNRRRILSTLPLHTISKELLNKILKYNDVSEEDKKIILKTLDSQKNGVYIMLKENTLEDEINVLTKEEFEKAPAKLFVSEAFIEKEIFYDYEDYLKHLDETKIYTKKQKNYTFSINNSSTFKNINITINKGKWVMLSKDTHPAIHFVIHHPKLRSAIENFTAVIKE